MIPCNDRKQNDFHVIQDMLAPNQTFKDHEKNEVYLRSPIGVLNLLSIVKVNFYINIVNSFNLLNYYSKDISNSMHFINKLDY